MKLKAFLTFFLLLTTVSWLVLKTAEKPSEKSSPPENFKYWTENIWTSSPNISKGKND